MPSAFFTLQNVHIGLEFGVRFDAAGFGNHHSPFDIFSFNASEQQTQIITGHPFVYRLVEHFHTRADTVLALFSQTDNFYRIADFDFPAFHSARHNRPAPFDREYIFNRHHEGFVHVPYRRRYIAVYGCHQFFDAGIFRSIRIRAGRFQRFQRRPANDRGLITRISVFLQQIPQFHLDQFQ